MVAPLVMAALPLLAEFAPGLVRWMAGDDAGDVADKVVGIAKQVTGTADADAAAAALRADPALALAFKQRAADIELELERATLADRQDARARDVAMRQAGQRNRRADAMLLMAFAALCLIIYLAWEGRLDMPDQVFSLLNLAAGYILKMIGDAFAFEFGSSRGSKEKDALLAALKRGPR